MGKAEDGFFGDLKGDLTLKHGNVRMLLGEVTGRGAYQLGVHTWLVHAYGGLGSQNGERNTEATFVHARWTAMWDPWVGSELFGQLQYDAFIDLSLRTLVGAGPRFAILLEEWIELYGGTGYMLEREVLSIPQSDPHPQRTLNHRWTSYVSFKLQFDEIVSARSVLYVQPRFDQFSDYRILEQLELQVKVAKHLALVNTFELRYDSDPPSQVRRLDLVLKVGLRVGSDL